jgi:hypothetical protein
MAVLLSLPVGVVPLFIRCRTPVVPGHRKETPADGLRLTREAVPGGVRSRAHRTMRAVSTLAPTARSSPAATGGLDMEKAGYWEAA